MSDDIAPPKPEPPNMAWLLTFADLVSLLLTFFVLLYSMKAVDQSQWDVIRGALSGVFSEEEATVIIHPDEFSMVETITQFPADSLPYLANVLKLEFRDDPVLSEMRSEYESQRDVLILALPSSLVFKAGQVKLEKEGRLALIKLADKLRHLDNRIQIAGHTDPSPLITEEIPTNWEMAMLRATSVAEIFYERGIDKKVPAFSYGDSRFDEIDDRLPQAERHMRARRVEIRIYGDNGNV